MKPIGLTRLRVSIEFGIPKRGREDNSVWSLWFGPGGFRTGPVWLQTGVTTLLSQETRHGGRSSSVAVKFRNQVGGFGVQLLLKLLEFLARILEEKLAVDHEQDSKDVEK